MKDERSNQSAFYNQLIKNEICSVADHMDNLIKKVDKQDEMMAMIFEKLQNIENIKV